MLLIAEKGQIMVITKQNPNGGPMLKVYRIEEDPNTGVVGYKLGYCPCGEPLLLRMIDVRAIVAKFGWSMQEYDEFWNKQRPRDPIMQRLRMGIIRVLGGKVE